MEEFIGQLLQRVAAIEKRIARTEVIESDTAAVSGSSASVNTLTNGGFDIQQRVAVAATAIPSVSTTSRAGQVADRWAVTVGNVTTPQWTRVDTAAAVETGLQTRYYGRITQLTNAAKFIFSQFIANEDMAYLRGEQVRLSCKIKNFAGANAVYKLGLLQLTAAGTVDTCPTFISAIGAASVLPTWGTNLAAITPDGSPTVENGTINGAFLDITSTADWVKSSCVFTVPIDAKNLCIVLFRDTLGAANDSLGVAEFQMTQSVDVIDWVSLPFALELLHCQRYFCKTFSLTTVPAQAIGVNTGEAKGIAGKAAAVADAGIIYWRLPTAMRVVATTTTLFNPAAANALMRDITGAVDMGATATTVTTNTSVTTHSTGDVTTAIGNEIGVHITVDVEFKT